MVRLGNYIGGRWTECSGGQFLDVHNPSTGQVIAQAPLSTPADVASAVASAAEAFKPWSRTPVTTRCDYLHELAGLLEADQEKICRVLVEEMGKSLPDARAEMKRTVENCRVACGMPVLQQGDKIIGVAADIDGEVIRLPIGVFAAIAPFNFPAMVPFWFIPYALATGNTIVVKASEKAPCTMQLIARHIEQVKLPAGAFNLVNGDKLAGEALVDHPAVKGVSIVGTSAVCRQVAARCAAANKRCQAMGSAKNHLVVMPDARMDQAVRNMITSCFGCAGQRCMASSVIVCVGEAAYREVCGNFIEASRGVVVANPLDPRYANEQMLMGPVISDQSRRRILDLIRQGIDEGAKLALDGRGIVVPGCEKGYFIGPTVFTDVRPGMTIHRTELFGPVVAVMQAASLEEAIAVINGHPYGNGASIYTQNGYYARRFKLEAQAGMIGVNVGIPAPAACLPFGGMKDSQFADIKAQGKAAVRFYTEEKVITERYWPEA